jgi:hypothetical protein
MCMRKLRCTGYSGQYKRLLNAQKTVPSLSISIGGPPVSGRLILAISLPPFQVAPSSTWASVSWDTVNPICERIRSAIRSLSDQESDLRFVHIEMKKTMYNSITVMARHSTMAGWEGTAWGRPDLASLGRTSGFSVKTPRSTRSPPVIYNRYPSYLDFH